MKKSIKNKFSTYIRNLQEDICENLEIIDTVGQFWPDNWEREEGGGGLSRILEQGDIFEKAGVNISTVFGELPTPIQQRFEVNERWFWARSEERRVGKECRAGPSA